MKELKFIHISKCAGTSIENAARKERQFWGRFHHEYGYRHKLFPRLSPWIIDKYDWFMVVRNPYERALSEYYWFFKNAEKINHTKEEMNSFIIDKIRQRSRFGNHFTEQYKYLHPTVNIRIIKFENLDEEFTALMKEYNLEKIGLGKENARNFQDYSVADFSPELITLINEVYDQDFAEFQYEKITAL